jgi:L-ascorbate metabolism protein UlaG (beta-lactamase superfamily)
MTNTVKDYRSNPQLESRKVPAGWRGTPVDEQERFVNLNHPFTPKFRDVLRWKFQKNPYRKEKQSEVWDPEIYRDYSWLMGQEDMIAWLGHCTFYIRINGIKMITDPVFGDIVSLKRQSEFPFDPVLLHDMDYILLSHDHRDHLDRKSLGILAGQNRSARYMAGLGMKKILQSYTGSDKIEEAGWYQQYNIRDHSLEISFVPSRHWSKRGLFDTNKRLWGGFVIEAPGRRILFGGDSAYDTHYAQLPAVFGNFSHALLGIGAYEPAWFMSSNHQSPAEAVKGFTELNAAQLIPMHYGTFDLSDEPLSMPLKDLHLAAARYKIEDKLKILTVGKPLVIS